MIYQAARQLLARETDGRRFRLIGVGVSQQIYMSLNNTLIQESVDDAYRGRVLSTMFLNRGMVPLGAMIAGFGTSLVGAPLTIGVMAAIMNRPGSLGPAEGVRSRGELPLEALDHADASEAAKALSAIEARSYRAFNLVIADDRHAFWLKGLGRSGDGRVAAMQLNQLVPNMRSPASPSDRGRPAD